VKQPNNTESSPAHPTGQPQQRRSRGTEGEAGSAAAEQAADGAHHLSSALILLIGLRADHAGVRARPAFVAMRVPEEAAQ
jgi:hypothetical protein